MDKVVCVYKEKCRSHPDWCGTCSHNGGRKDYYKKYDDKYEPHTPWIPPFRPIYEPVWIYPKYWTFDYGDSTGGGQ